ncbi:hypothetical protein [Microcoleus asticus]|uniref:hypothetical protein n=1 Tax=Microcoleus asticus TaxID=2815231 RepID=UPI001552636F|nr:hypothetical protein [Microcoleus asticus]
MIVRGIDLFLTADVCRWTEINADKLGRSRFWRRVRSPFALPSAIARSDIFKAN